MHRSAYLLLLLTTIFWGGNAVAGRLAVDHVSPMLLTTARWGIACALLSMIGLPRLHADWPVIRSHWFLLLALGAVGFAAFNIVVYAAAQYTTALNISIEHAGMPAVILLANFILFRVRVHVAQIAGFLVSIAGLLVTASHGDPARLLDLDVNFGDALMIIGVLVYGGYSVALRFKPDVHWLSLMIALTFGATMASLPFTIAEAMVDATILPDLRGWGVIAYTAIFPSIVAQIFYIRGVDLIGSNRAGLFINLVPISGALLSILILGEQFFAYHAIALVLVLCGIALGETSSRKMAD